MEFFHTIGGRSYRSDALLVRPSSLDQYKDQVRKAYGTLRGVAFYTSETHEPKYFCGTLFIKEKEKVVS